MPKITYSSGRSSPITPSWGWKPNHPMIEVSYVDIAGVSGSDGYCGWASERLGLKVRLPTEAQWEYCARDGGKPIKYPWGNRFNRWLVWTSTNTAGDALRTAPVVRKDHVFVNKLGLSDMSGNVSQWCRDWYNIDYPTGVVTDPTGPIVGESHCIRGSGWIMDALDMSTSFECGSRSSWFPDYRSNHTGFRLCTSG